MVIKYYRREEENEPISSTLSYLAFFGKDICPHFISNCHLGRTKPPQDSFRLYKLRFVFKRKCVIQCSLKQRRKMLCSQGRYLII